MTHHIVTGNYMYFTCHHAQLQSPGTGAPKWILVSVDTPVLFMLWQTKMCHLKMVYHALGGSQQIKKKKTSGWLHSFSHWGLNIFYARLDET